jgi:hypothetical protein
MRLSNQPTRPPGRAAVLCIAIKRARRSLSEARRQRNRAVTERAHRLAPGLVHVSVAAAVTMSFALPVFVVIFAHNDIFAILCPRFVNLKVVDAWVLASWAPTTLLWMCLRWYVRARRRRLAHQSYAQGKTVQG